MSHPQVISINCQVAFLSGGKYAIIGCMAYQLIDTHAHLEELADLEMALGKAKEAGVIAIIAVGSGLQSNKEVRHICQKYRHQVYPALGLHPWELGNIDSTQVDEALHFIEGNMAAAVAIGEIGLDYDKRVVKLAPKERQKEVLRSLLRLAQRDQKPVVIHSRYAWQDSFAVVKEAGLRKAVFHWYTGFPGVLREILEAGYFISATPAAEYHEEHRRAIKETPLEQLLLETDCPVFYGRENRYKSEPADIMRTLKAVALLKGVTEDFLAWQTTRNASLFFGLDIMSVDYPKQR